MEKMKLSTEFSFYVDEVNRDNCVMTADSFEEEDIHLLFNEFDCNKLIVTKKGKIIREFDRKTYEVDKLCDEIHKNFLCSNTKDKKKLREICSKNNILLDDYLYNQGYQDFNSYLDDISVNESYNYEI